MDKTEKVAAYFEQQDQFKQELEALRKIALDTGLQETFKWSLPVYTLNGKNVLGLAGFKNHYGIWFFNGVFLKDPEGLLSNAQEGKTKAMRHWRFEAGTPQNPNLIKAYFLEAIENEKKGLKLVKVPSKKLKPRIPLLLNEAFKKEPELRESFEKLPPYKQKDFCEHLSSAKQATTRQRRLVKALELIRQGKGLNDKYQNC